MELTQLLVKKKTKGDNNLMEIQNRRASSMDDNDEE